jgi:uncharacterized protein (TIGR00661 family)
MTRVLVIPLDWGFGHATRCIPIIQALLTRQCEVYIGGSGGSLALLKKEFPTLTTFEFPGYAPTYPARGSMVWKMLKQLPHFVTTIIKEHRFLHQIIQEHAIDLVISDNRYGCYSADIPSIFITHQSNIQMPKRFGFLAPVVRYVNGLFMKKFSECWFPDYPGIDSLAGTLTDTSPNIKARHIGALSRFHYNPGVVKTYDLICVLSGPEPQRTILENLLIEQLSNYTGTFLFVRGITEPRPWKATFPYVSLLTSAELQEAIQASHVVIARSGYSTIMDLARVGAKAVLIPTPGQTEQVYLAKRLSDTNTVVYVNQALLNLREALAKVSFTNGFKPKVEASTLLDNALEMVLQKYPKADT